MRQAEHWLLRTAVASAMLLASCVQGAEPSDIWSHVDASRVCPITSVWRIGVGPGRTPSDMIETVVPLEVDGRPVWRIMHTMLRGVDDLRAGATPGSDLLDVERATLAPLQSEHRTRSSASAPVSINRFDYRAAAPDAVLRLNGDGSPAERITLGSRQRVFAEPESAVLDQAIAWSDGLKIRGYSVHRWRGRDDERLHQVEIAVTGRGAVEIGGRKIETFLVREQPSDSTAYTLRQITVERPHRQVYVQIFSSRHRQDDHPFTSEVTALLQDTSCAKTP
jgi:hypothetical protein